MCVWLLKKKERDLREIFFYFLRVYGFWLLDLDGEIWGLSFEDMSSLH